MQSEHVNSEPRGRSELNSSQLSNASIEEEQRLDVQQGLKSLFELKMSIKEGLIVP